MPILWGLALLSLGSQDTARIRLLMELEDARHSASLQMTSLMQGARSQDSLISRWAVRGLGRQQNVTLASFELRRALDSGSVGVRAEAANALAQSTPLAANLLVRDVLMGAAVRESDPVVLGAILRSLGRLANPTAKQRAAAEGVLLRKGLLGASGAPAVEGALHGLASLYRRTVPGEPPAADAVAGIVSHIGPSESPMVRRLAMAALVSSGRVDSGTALRALNDTEREVRRLAGLAAFGQTDLKGREEIIEKAWHDPDFAVRYESLRAYARHVGPRAGCGRIVGALDDANLHVRLLAIDLLGACGTVAVPRLTAIAREPIIPDAWHRPAHALVALARADSTAITALLPAFVTSTVPWARMYGARAAEGRGDTLALMRLARDSVAIVREAALSGLHRRMGHAADALYLAALDSRDYMVLLTAAQALDSSPHPRAIAALGTAFARITAEKRETSRDPRMAMLASIEHIGSAPLATQLRAAATDFDTTVAATAARMASRWSANTIEPAPQPLSRQPVPSWSDLTAWNRLTAVITMQGGGMIRMRLRPFDAPTNVARFIRMVRSGWFNGLTWHRVVPNFVVQGGSPGANEYMGDGPFTRDELGLGSHVRGTVGISTRGRDTGDGQLFFNLIDNWRLDHDYTIIGEVIEGMDVVDRTLEGAVILRVDLLEDKP